VKPNEKELRDLAGQVVTIRPNSGSLCIIQGILRLRNASTYQVSLESTKPHYYATVVFTPKDVKRIFVEDIYLF